MLMQTICPPYLEHSWRLWFPEARELRREAQSRVTLCEPTSQVGEPENQEIKGNRQTMRII